MNASLSWLCIAAIIATAVSQGDDDYLDEVYDVTAGDYPTGPIQVLNDKCVMKCVVGFTRIVQEKTGMHPAQLPSVGLFLDEIITKGICAGREFMLECVQKCPDSTEKRHKVQRLHRDFMQALCHNDVLSNFNFTCYNKAVKQMEFQCTTCDVKLIAQGIRQTKDVCNKMHKCIECSIFNVEWFCGYETQLQARIIFGELAKDVYRMARDEEGPSVNLPPSPEGCAKLMVDAYLAKAELEMEGRKREGWANNQITGGRRSGGTPSRRSLRPVETTPKPQTRGRSRSRNRTTSRSRTRATPRPRTTPRTSRTRATTRSRSRTSATPRPRRTTKTTRPPKKTRATRRPWTPRPRVWTPRPKTARTQRPQTRATARPRTRATTRSRWTPRTTSKPRTTPPTRATPKPRIRTTPRPRTRATPRPTVRSRATPRPRTRATPRATVRSRATPRPRTRATPRPTVRRRVTSRARTRATQRPSTRATPRPLTTRRRTTWRPRTRATTRRRTTRKPRTKATTRWTRRTRSTPRATPRPRVATTKRTFRPRITARPRTPKPRNAFTRSRATPSPARVTQATTKKPSGKLPRNWTNRNFNQRSGSRTTARWTPMPRGRRTRAPFKATQPPPTRAPTTRTTPKPTTRPTPRPTTKKPKMEEAKPKPIPATSSRTVRRREPKADKEKETEKPQTSEKSETAGQVKPSSGADLPDDCVDRHPSCKNWSMEGQCGWNPPYMGVMCQRSCRCCGCKESDAAERIRQMKDLIPTYLREIIDSLPEDASPSLIGTARKAANLIKDFPSFLREHNIQLRTLGDEEIKDNLSESSEEDIDDEPESLPESKEDMEEKLDLASVPELELPEEESSFDSHCTDSTEDCEKWAKNGECGRNPSWMKPHCQKSCDCCGCKEEDFEDLSKEKLDMKEKEKKSKIMSMSDEKDQKE